VQVASLRETDAPAAGRAVVTRETDRASRPEVAEDKATETFGGMIPLPPRRPVEVVASLAEETLPLPPTRPDSLRPDSLRPDSTLKVSIATAEDEAALPAPLPTPLARPTTVPDAIGGLIGTTAQGLPAIRKAELPAIITQGTEQRRLPEPALAFAATETTGTLRAVVPEPQRSSGPTRTLGLRGIAALRGELKTAKHHPTAIASAASARVSDPIAALAGPPICGLRRAAKGIGATPSKSSATF
jgi:hypothetical protein